MTSVARRRAVNASLTLPRLEDEHPYFLTCTVAAWLPVFVRPEFAEVLLNSWRFLQRERGIQIFGYVIMENHVHWIARGPGLSAQVGLFKSFTARTIIDLMESRGYVTLLQELQFQKQRHKVHQKYQLWQDGSHPQQIQGDEMMVQKLEYTHANPVRRGYIDDPTHWRYSSARDYAGQPGLMDVITDWG